MKQLLTLPAKAFLGKGLDKKVPFLVSAYKAMFAFLAKEGETAVRIPLGITLLVSNKDSGLGMYLRTKGKFEPLQTRLFLRSLKENDVVLDIGANVGYYTLLASKKVGKRGKVYAFEPDARNIAVLRKNIAANGCTNVVILPFALGRKNGKTTFTLDLANPGESHVKRGQKEIGGKQITVKMATLDSVVKKYGIKRINVVKMDIEGGELETLAGASTTFTKRKNTTLFIECNKSALNNAGQTPLDMVNMLETLRFDVRSICNEFDATLTRFSLGLLTSLLKKTSYVTLVAKK